jgi:MFS transporter, putative metabolite:H+ symporter
MNAWPCRKGESVAKPASITPEIIGQAIDIAPITKRLAFIIAVAAAGYFFDSFDISLISYVLPSVAKEFHLAPQQLGLVGSAGLAGMAVGSWAWGWIADRWGRTLVFSLTVLTFSLFTGVAALTYSAGFLIGARFLTGLGLGGTIPVDSALVAEYAPARLRGRLGGFLPFAWPIGIFVAAGVGLAVVPTIGWRWLFVVGALPALLAYVIRRGVPESPRWLAGQGRTDEALQSLQYVGIGPEILEQARRELEAKPARPVVKEARITDLFTRAYARRVVHTWSMWFFSSLGNWAFFVWLPTVYATIYHIELTRTLFYTFIVAGASVVGRFVALWLVDRIGRKPVIVGGFLLAGIAAWFFNVANTEATLVAVAVTYAFFADQGALGMTVYTPEVYPLRIRGIGTACAMACGRIAGVISPFAVGLIIGARNISLMWWLMGLVEMIAALMTLWLGVETRGVNLERLSEATGPRDALA